MAHYHVDIAGLWVDEFDWWRYLVWIDNLPRSCRLWSAVLEDPDAFDPSTLEEEEKEPRGPSNPKLYEFPVEVEHLTNIEDLLKQLLTITMAANMQKGKKPPKLPPSPRPVNIGREKAKHRLAMQKHEDLKRMLLPHLYDK